MTLPTEKTWKISVIFFSSDPPLPQRKGEKKKVFFPSKKLPPYTSSYYSSLELKETPTLLEMEKRLLKVFFKTFFVL